MKPIIVHVQQYFIHSLLLKQILLSFQWKTMTTVKSSTVFQFSSGTLHRNIAERLGIADLKFDIIGYDFR